MLHAWLHGFTQYHHPISPKIDKMQENRICSIIERFWLPHGTSVALSYPLFHAQVLRYCSSRVTRLLSSQLVKQFCQACLARVCRPLLALFRTGIVHASICSSREVEQLDL